jgi:hypothetical protein
MYVCVVCVWYLNHLEQIVAGHSRLARNTGWHDDQVTATYGLSQLVLLVALQVCNEMMMEQH